MSQNLSSTQTKILTVLRELRETSLNQLALKTKLTNYSLIKELLFLVQEGLVKVIRIGKRCYVVSNDVENEKKKK